jgi:ribonuclease HI
MPDRPVRVVAAACDGACSGNPGPGGWGALLRFEDGGRRELGGADPDTTNNRMELTAALALLEELRDQPRHPDLVVHTDSRYLIDGLQRWMTGWKRRGWRTASGGAVLNRDLWERLDSARLPGLRFQHVRGHSGDPDNERCDEIAVAFARGGRPRLAGGDPVTPACGPAPAPAEPAAAGGREAAPPELARLIGRLELADRLATGAYGLSLVELARLVDQPLAELERRRGTWRWRDWQVRPLGEGRWRLVREAGGLGQPETEAG